MKKLLVVFVLFSLPAYAQPSIVPLAQIKEEIRPYEPVPGSFQNPIHCHAKDICEALQKTTGGLLTPSAIGGLDLIYIPERK